MEDQNIELLDRGQIGDVPLQFGLEGIVPLAHHRAGGIADINDAAHVAAMPEDFALGPDSLPAPARPEIRRLAAAAAEQAEKLPILPGPGFLICFERRYPQPPPRCR